MRNPHRSRPVFAAFAALAALALGAACDGRPAQSQGTSRADAPPSPNEPLVAELDLSSGVPEAPAMQLFGPSRRRTHFDWVLALRALPDAANVRGLLVHVGPGIGLPRAAELGRLLGEARERGLPVVCHGDEYDQAALLLAAQGCSRTWVSPAGGVDAVGIAMELVFMRELFEKLHVQVDMLQVGKYKGAAEPFTRDDSSPEARASYQRALGSIRHAWIDGITQGKKNPALAGVVEDGPYSAPGAKAVGLIDAVGFASEARADVTQRAGVSYVSSRFGADAVPGASREISELLRAISGGEGVGVPHVAVVRASGAISMASSGSPFGGSEGIAESDLGAMLHDLTRDESVKAVVLRIDSPGGSALASDLLWKRLMDLRAKKPLVVSVGSYAASGGYYMACAGTKIFAESTSIVGSIGVVGGKFAVGKTLEQVGIHVETITANEDPNLAARAAYMSMFSGWDEPTRARMLASMTDVYDLFLARISESRGLALDSIAKSAEGQLFGGADAKERGLIDAVGGLREAITAALELSGLPADAPIEAVGAPPGLFGLLSGDESDDEGNPSAALAQRAAAEAVARAAVTSIAPGLSELPPELHTFVASAWPLVRGERTLAALPFALRLR
jgi:protease-4